DLEKLRGEYDEAFELFDTARQATDDVRAWLGLADTLRNQGAHDDALRVLDDAFAAVDWSDDERARLWLERSWILAVAGRHAEAAAVLHEGITLAQRIGSIEDVGGCLVNLGMVEEERGDLEQGLACDRQAVEEFDRIGHGTGKAHAYCNLADKLSRAGRYEEA